MRLGSRLLLCGLVSALVLAGCGGKDATQHVQTYDAAGRALRPVTCPAELPNLVVVVVDSLRADAVPLSRGEVTTGSAVPMPWLSSFAARSTTLESVTAPAPWTLPSMISMLTGLLPREHGQHEMRGPWHPPEAVTTFAEILRESYGYDTAAFVYGEWFGRRGHGQLAGFDRVGLEFTLQVTDSAVRQWLADRPDTQRPFFLLLHTMDAHSPYGERNHPWPPGRMGRPRVDPALLAPDADPAEIFRRCWTDADTMLGLSLQRGASLPDLLQRYLFRGYGEAPRPDLASELATAYWDGVRWTDGLLEETHASLERQGLLENTLLVITSDHGEAFGEHGNLGHGLQVWDEVIQIPLILSGPPPFDRPALIQDEVGLIDLLPTFFDWAGMEPHLGTRGRSFLGLLDDEIWCRPVTTEERLTRANTGGPERALLLSVRTRRWKYTLRHDRRNGEVREQMFDLLADPGEHHDLVRESGRLPPDLELDGCLCLEIEALRDRVWGEAGTPAPETATSRPPPCRGP